MELTQAALEFVVCPVCYSRLRLAREGIDCTGCDRRYPILDGLPILIASRATHRTEPGAVSVREIGPNLMSQRPAK